MALTSSGVGFISLNPSVWPLRNGQLDTEILQNSNSFSNFAKRLAKSTANDCLCSV